MSHYYNEITGEILDYPDEAAALFPVLKRVPSERTVEVTVDDDEKLEDSISTENVSSDSDSQSSTKTIKNGVTNAK